MSPRHAKSSRKATRPTLARVAADVARLKRRFDSLRRDALPSPLLPVSAPRFTKLDAKGQPTAGDHVAVYDAKTGLTWSAGPLLDGKGLNHADAMQACKKLDLLGHKDWRAPTVEELLSIIDYARANPAVDSTVFKGPYVYTWSSTLYADNPSGFAWIVGSNYGNAFWSFRSSHYHVRAVRAGQSPQSSVRT